MPTKLDEISVAIGEMRAGLRALGRSLDSDRAIGNRRHSDNQKSIGEVSRDVAGLARKLDEHARAVSLMRPELASLRRASRKQLALAGSIGLLVVSLIAWSIESGLAAVIGWARTHWH